MFPSAPSQCNNCSAAEGIPAHLFWFCPQFFDFCSAIFTRFLNVTTKTSNQITTLQWLLKLFCYQTQLWKNNTDTLTFIELQPCNVWILETATHTRPAHSLTSQDGGRQKGSSTGLEIHPPPKFELWVCDMLSVPQLERHSLDKMMNKLQRRDNVGPLPGAVAYHLTT